MASATLHSLNSRLGGYATAARYDAMVITGKARSTYRESFRDGHRCKLCPAFTMPEGLSEGEIVRRAEALRRAHYTRLAIASGNARRRTSRAPALPAV
jgi:hypothetical protein